ncbi:MAG: LacI family DNA-binding transcriptional regulator [Clostridium sp.]|nr:LacI family DNA-binding transcriptional regulator [Clostridium sp.]
MKITIQEVAKKANVSVATVSRVMNGNYPVKAETKERVMQVISELNYIPNIQARELTKQKSTAVGVVVPSINNMFFTELITGIEKSLKENSLSLILTCSNDDYEEEKECINNLIARNVSGIIVASPSSQNIKSGFYKNIAEKLPIVFINSDYTDLNISCVSTDESAGAKCVLDYLEKNNHKNILFVRGKDSYSYDIKEKTYTEYMKNINNFKPENIINIGNGNSVNTVENTMNIFLTLLPNRSFSAVFACNDLMAVGILNACKKLHINVPSDLSIIGYDNIPLCSFVEPKLTTIDQKMAELGINAAELLLEKIECNNTCSKRIILYNSLIERETVSHN